MSDILPVYSAYEASFIFYDEFRIWVPKGLWLDKWVDYEPFENKGIVVYLEDGSLILYDPVLRTFPMYESYEDMIEHVYPKDAERWKNEFRYNLGRYTTAWKQNEFAYESGISEGSMSNYGWGYSIPSLHKMIIIGRTLNVSPDEFLRLICYRNNRRSRRLVRTNGYEKFSDRLKILMEEKGYTQYRLSKETGISQPSIQSYLYKDRDPSFLNVMKIAWAMDLSNKEMLDFVGF